MNNKFGIYDKSYLLILESLRSFPEVKKAFIFGSRAMKKAKKGSDIDIAVSGDTISEKTISRLSTQLNDHVPVPYYIDIAHLEKITNKNLLEHIRQYGVVFYERND
jgi:predicted nucleotidyltransferase